MKGIISCGHWATADAAELALRSGGNAFDAAICALLVSCVSEPCIASFSSGLIGVIKPAYEDVKVIDAFAKAPGKRNESIKAELFPIEVDFVNVIDRFYYGRGAVATTGYFRAILILAEYSQLPLKELIDIAISLLKNGIPLSEFAVMYLNHLEPTFLVGELYETYCDENKQVLKPGENVFNTRFIDLLETIKRDGPAVFLKGEVTEEIHKLLQGKGHLSRNDLINYRAEVKKARSVFYKNAYIHLPGFPSWGSKIVEELFSRENRTTTMADHLIETLRNIKKTRLLEKWRKGGGGQKFGGTGHVSIADGEGNILALSYSIGEGSGLMTPYSGIHLNNMLGEPSLFQGAIDSWKEGEELISMMTPALVDIGKYRIAMGSGGSERIPQTIFQVIESLIEISDIKPLTDRVLKEIVENPRVFYKKDYFHFEPGFKDKLPSKQGINHNEFTAKSFFYGGVNLASHMQPYSLDAVADSRRRGVVRYVE